jgi:hypothetical protein
MADLECTMLQLNLDQYLDVFIAEGFDSWQTVLDITEADLCVCVCLVNRPLRG